MTGIPISGIGARLFLIGFPVSEGIARLLLVRARPSENVARLFLVRTRPSENVARLFLVRVRLSEYFARLFLIGSTVTKRVFLELCQFFSISNMTGNSTFNRSAKWIANCDITSAQFEQGADHFSLIFILAKNSSFIRAAERATHHQQRR